MPSSSREKLEAWLQAKREAANMSIEEWDELLNIEDDDAPNAEEDQHGEKENFIHEPKVPNLSNCEKDDLFVMINALQIQITCLNDDLDDKDEIIEELELKKKKGQYLCVSRLKSQETDVPNQDTIKALSNKVKFLTKENIELYDDLMMCSKKLMILKYVEKEKLIAKHQACWLYGNNKHLHPVCFK